MTTTDTDHRATEARWAPRTALAWALRAGLFLAPILVSAVFVFIASRVVPRPPFVVGTVAWWVAITAAATLVLRAVDRSLQRFVPVVALLRLSLTFPDHAPSRFKLAMRSGTVRQFERRYQSGELRGTPQEAAESLLTLVGNLGSHDRLTRGHSERVRAYSILIADELGLTQAERDLLQWAALLHDIGKLDVPADLLNKDGRPTENEWDVIRAHPGHSEGHLAPLASWLGDWRLAASQHHERWDGAGYPLGLAGDQISMAGRIVAVADAYDTITSVRSYKQAASAEEGRAEIARCAGTQFDPTVVRAFLAVSVRNLRGIMGPLSWLAHVPILASVPAAATPTVTNAVTASAAVISMGMTGIAAPPPAEPTEPVSVEAAAAPEFELAFVAPTATPFVLNFPTPTTAATTPPTAPPAPGATPLPAPTAENTTGPTAVPTATPVPTGTAVPQPSSTPTTAPTAAPTTTATPPPTPSPTTTPTATPTATPPPAAVPMRFYLENPGTGETASSVTLPMRTTTPMGIGLPNYDTDHDSREGLLVRRTSNGLAENDPEKMQLWVQNLEGTTLTGPASLRIHAAPSDYDWDGDDMALTAALQRCNAAVTSCTTLASGTQQFDSPAIAFYATVDFDFGTIETTFTPSEPVLALKIIVPDSSQDRLWIAYDTGIYRAAIDVEGY